ncbi:MAG: 4-hydroxy-3-methylbut-2-enyl diphosphate reductase [Candidatus Margulisiibacteriota bacterium]
MPEIISAQHSGFCEGVSAAYKTAVLTAQKGQNVFMLGNLVHNTQVVDKLKDLGIKVLSSLSEIPQNATGSLLISAHGVAPHIYEEAEKKGLNIIDTTCSWVKRAQKIAKEMGKKGMTVVIVGDEGHPEVKGLIGWAGKNSVVIENPEEASDLDFISFFQPQVGVVAQTTQSEDNFNSIVAELKKHLKDLEVHNTICGATEKRQKAAVELARGVDLMLVIGDQKSANTKRLTELCSKTGTETHQIQTAKELDPQWLKGKGKVGLTAGASTPDWVVEEVVRVVR